VRMAVGAGERVCFWGSCGRGFLLDWSGTETGFDFVYFGEDAGQLFLEVALGGLVVIVGKFADAVFELEVAEILVDGGFPLVEVGEGGDGLRLGQVLRPNAEDEDDDNDRQDTGNCDDHRKQ